MIKSLSILFAAALLGQSFVSTTARGESSAAVQAQFRGCDAAGWCRFSIALPDASAETLQRVRPDGVAPAPYDDAAIVVRDRLNALLASMIHQHKLIELHALRELDDGTFAASITVNGLSVAADPILQELRNRQ